MLKLLEEVEVEVGVTEVKSLSEQGSKNSGGSGSGVSRRVLFGIVVFGPSKIS